MTVWRSRIRTFFLVFGWTALLLLFPHVTHMQLPSAPNLPAVHEGHRLEQAHELLGKRYEGSVVQKSEGKEYLNYHIYSKLERSLPEVWKAQAGLIASTLISESEAQELDPIFVMAIIQTESQFNPKALGDCGDRGLMQILPQTARWISKRHDLPWTGANSLYDPVTNLKIGITYFGDLRDEFENVPKYYLPAYNMGPTRVHRKLSKRHSRRLRINAHILRKDYARKVMKNYAMIYKQMMAPPKIGPAGLKQVQLNTQL